MKTRSLSFDNRSGHRLAARLDLPADGEPLACALFAHCFTCSKNLKAVGQISRALTRQGLAVLRFDFTGLGHSEGTFADTNFSSNISDLVDAAAFMAEMFEAPRILVGHSLGGAAVLQAASQLPSVRAVATIGAPYAPSHVKHLFAEATEDLAHQDAVEVNLGGRPFTIKRQFIDDLDQADTAAQIGALGRALIIFHAPQDQLVGIDNAAQIYAAARHPKSFISLDDADHLLTRAADAEYVGSVLAAWARKYLDVPQEETKHTAPADNHVVARIGRDHYRTEILANGHPLVADEPKAVGGTNQGPTPYDLLLAGLGACTAMTLRMYADRKKWPLESVSVRLHYAKVHANDCDCADDGQTGKIDLITRTLTLEGPLDASQRARLKEIANRCPVHRTLEGEIVVQTTLAPDDTAEGAIKEGG